MSLDRVVVGGGHFVQRGGELVQQFVEKAPDLARAFERGTERMLFHSNVQHRIMNPSVIHPKPDIPIMLVADNESSAWQDFMDKVVPEHTREGLKEIALAYGSAASGDIEGALEHGVNATVEAAQQFLDNLTTWGTWASDNR